MTYVKESLRFIILSFFKRCRIMIRILIKEREVKNQESNNMKPRTGGNESFRAGKDTRESIIADMLAQNLKWAFLTILTCIEKSEA